LTALFTIEGVLDLV